MSARSRTYFFCFSLVSRFSRVGGSTFLRWIRIALFVGAVLVIAWFVLQLFVQTSLLDWIGDRIDSIGSE